MGVFAIAVACSGLPTGLAAQDNESYPWKDSYYPYLTSQGRDFPLLVAHFEERKAADYFARAPYAGKFTLDVGASLKGGKLAVAEFRAPLLWERWRLTAQLGATREVRYGFFGLGNNTVQIDSLQNSTQPFYYRARRTLYFGGAELSRWVAPHVAVALAGRLEQARFSALPGPSIFRATQGSLVSQTDAIGRLALVYDSRDNEFDTHQGLFVEADGLLGSGGTGNGYSRLTLIGRGYIQIREGTVLGARIAGSAAGGTPTLNARFSIPTWETIIPVLGGGNSHRGLEYQRLAGQDVLLANAEVRHDLLNLGDYGALTLIVFGDAGRVFDGEPFKITTSGMKTAGGGGIAIRVLRSTIFTLNFAGGSEGFVFTTGGGWMF